MKRTVLAFAAAAVLLGFSPAQAKPRKGAVPTPAIWVDSLEEAAKQARINKPMYIYFHPDDDKTELPEQFWYHPGMYNISRKEAVFVLIKVPKKPSDEMKELLKKYRVTRLGTAVLADKDGNLLTAAETKSADTLLKQIRKIRVVIEEIAADLEARMKRAAESLEKGDTDAAKIAYQGIIRKYPTYAEAAAAAEQIEKIDNPPKEEPAKDPAPPTEHNDKEAGKKQDQPPKH